MTFSDGFLGFWLFLVALAVWLSGRALVRSLTWAVGAVELIHEALAKLPPALSAMSDGSAPNGLATRIEAVESGFQGVKLTVADAVEKVVALSNRLSARQRRRDELEHDEEPETGPSPEALKALAQLTGGVAPVGAAGDSTDGGTSPATALSLKQRAHRQLTRGGK